MRLGLPAAVGLLGSGLLAACGGAGDPPPVSAVIEAAEGDNQVGEAGLALTDSLAVLLRAQGSNAPISGLTVNWSVTGGGGSVSPTQSVTNALGIARTRRILGPSAGIQTTRAFSPLASAELLFESTARIQGAFKVANQTTGSLSDTTLATLSTPMSVFVSDENDAPVAGVVVQWSAVGGGSVSASSVPTNASGISTTQFTFGPTAGNQTAQATVTGLVGSPVSIALTATAGNATTLVKSSGDGGTAAPGASVTLTAGVTDARGNGVSGVAVDWAVGTGGGSVSPAQSVTGAAGTATTSRTLSATPGAHTTTATVASLAGPPTVTFTTTAAAPAGTTVTVSNNAFSPSAVTVNAGATVTWTWAAGAVQHNVTFGSVAGAPAHIADRFEGSEGRTFATAGTFPYQCTIHGASMSGTVTVNP